MHGESRRQSLGQVHDKVADMSWTQVMKVGNVICVADFHDLCPRQVRDFVGNLSRTLSQSQRNGIWAITSLSGNANMGRQMPRNSYSMT